MKTRALSWIVLVLVLAFPAEALPFSGNGDSQGNISPERGMYVFEAYCVSCHGPGGRGDGPISESLYLDFGVRPTDLGAEVFQKSRTDLQLALAVVLGGAAVHKTSYMPAWDQTLNEAQVDDLIAYVRHLRLGAPREMTSSTSAVVDTLDVGRFLYVTRCQACHGPQGRGDGPVLATLAQEGTPLPHLPDLSDYRSYLYARSDQHLEATVNAGFQHTGWPKPPDGWWDRPLKSHEIRALIFYLRTLCIQPIQKYGEKPPRRPAHKGQAYHISRKDRISSERKDLASTPRMGNDGIQRNLSTLGPKA